MRWGGESQHQHQRQAASISTTPAASVSMQAPHGYPCCEKSDRSTTYNLSRLVKLHTQQGYTIQWFAGVPSPGEATIDRMRESEDGAALHAALALCSEVEVHGIGWLRLENEDGSSDLVDSRYYDQRVGRCVRPTSEVKKPAAGSPSWRVERLRAELLMHVWHSFGIVRWVL